VCDKNQEDRTLNYMHAVKTELLNTVEVIDDLQSYENRET